MIKAIVISGPSGVGKTTIIRRILEDQEIKDKLLFSVSYTTREKRPKEAEGRDYFFVSKKDFYNLVKSDQMLEWAEVHGNLYGTPKSNLHNALSQGKLLLLDIDVQGAEALKKKLSNECLLIFIKPPNIEELRKRIIRRRDTKDVERRIKKAQEEMEKSNIFDFVIVNDNLEEAIKQIKEIITKSIES